MFVLLLLAGLFSASCATTPPRIITKKPDTVKKMSRAEQLKAVRALYNPPACFTSSYRIWVKDASNKTQKVKGYLRVDNKREALDFRFTDPIFGMTLSRVVIRDKQAYIRNPFAPAKYRKQKAPVDRFAVSGLGKNSMVLPFRLFQDLLFARLPGDLFLPEARLEKKGPAEMDIFVVRSTEKYRYRFTANRLSSLLYENIRTGDQVLVELLGIYKKTLFPRQIKMRMKPPKGKPEFMWLHFDRLNLKARCALAHFPVF